MNEARTNGIYQQQNCKTTNLLANSDFSMMQVRAIKRVSSEFTVYQHCILLYLLIQLTFPTIHIHTNRRSFSTTECYKRNVSRPLIVTGPRVEITIKQSASREGKRKGKPRRSRSASGTLSRSWLRLLHA